MQSEDNAPCNPAMQQPSPEWEKSRLVVVDPAIWKTYQQRTNDLRPVYRELARALHSLGVETRIITGKDAPLDIWVRDWGPVEHRYFTYKPSYAAGLYSPSAIKKARKRLNELLGRQHRTIPIVLDGGNLVHNGEVAILTEKVLMDNSQLSRCEIERAILSLGFERLVIIPCEPEDVVGHADGILRFIAPDVVLVNDYTGSHFAVFRRRLSDTLRRARLNAEPVLFPWFSIDGMNDGVWSAIGCYINFIVTACGIVVPAFDHPFDDRAAEVLKRHTTLPIRQVFATPLARLGGVLNCVTLAY